MPLNCSTGAREQFHYPRRWQLSIRRQVVSTLRPRCRRCVTSSRRPSRASRIWSNALQCRWTCVARCLVHDPSCARHRLKTAKLLTSILSSSLTEDDQIAGVTVWNTRNGCTTWKARLSIQALEGITTRFIAMLLEEDNATG